MEIQNRHFPMMAGFESTDYFASENIELWEDFHKLPETAQKILNAKEIAEIIFNIEKRYYLSEEETENISKSIREYFFREITQEELLNRMAPVCNISVEEAEKILRKISGLKFNIQNKSEFNTQENIQETVKKINLDKNKFNIILEKYPKILDQKITKNKITNPKTGEQVQPTLKNWIRMYEIEFGASKHTVMGRGNFVFQSRTTRGLNEFEKQIISQLLKMKDENSEMSVDIEKNEVVFDSVDIEKNDEDLNNNFDQSQKQIITKQSNNSFSIQGIDEDVNVSSNFQQQKSDNDFLERSNIGQVDELKNKLLNNQRQLEKLEDEIKSNQQENAFEYEQQVDLKLDRSQKQSFNSELIDHERHIISEEIPQKEQYISENRVFQEKPKTDMEKEILKNRTEMNNEVHVDEFQKIDDSHIGIQSNLITSKKVKTPKKRNIKLIKTNKKQKPSKYIKQDAINKVQKVENSENNVSGSITFSSNHRMPGE